MAAIACQIMGGASTSQACSSPKRLAPFTTHAGSSYRLPSVNIRMGIMCNRCLA